MTTQKETQPVDPRAFRNVIGLFATGVTVIATEVEGEPYGMTANALTSVSLDPLIILVCIQKSAQMAEHLRQSQHFSVNILSEGQQDLSSYFAKMWHEDKAAPDFTFTSWNNSPRLQGVLGALDCNVDQYIEGGDHWIVTARVVDLYQQELPGKPLLYYYGGYKTLSG